MDPVSILVILLAAWGIVQRTPALLRQAGEDLASMARGDGAPNIARIRAELVGEGIPLTPGGRVRSALGDLVKNLLHQADADRRAKAAARKARGGGRWADWRNRVDDAVTGWVDRRTGRRPGELAVPAPEPDPQPTSGADPGPGVDPGHPPSEGYDPADLPPVRVSVTVGTPVPDLRQAQPAPVPGPAPLGTRPRAGSQPNSPLPGFLDPDWGGPMVTPLDTSTTTAVLEGPQPMSDLATRGGHVTGVISGAAEARAIEAAIRAAADDFTARLSTLQARLYGLGDATLTIVQFAGNSTVVNACVSAAEALAAAKGAANTCTGEVTPALLQVAREFDARNS